MPNFDYSTPEGQEAFRQWYAQQQGGQRPEDMARYGWTGNEENQGNRSGDTYKRWDPYLQREGQYAGKYKSSRGAEGYYDKPTECPPGYMPSGPSETDPCVPNGSGGGGGGGGRGGGGGGGGKGGKGGSQWDNPIYKYLKGQAMDQDKWQGTWMGQGGATGYQQEIDAARARVEAMPAGPARDAALARINQMGTGTLRQAAEKDRMSMLSGNLMPQEYQYVGLGENARQANMANKLGWYNAETGRIGTEGNLGLGQQQMDWTRYWQPTQMGWQGEQNALDRAAAEKQWQAQIKESKPSFWQKLGGAISGGIGLATGVAGAGGWGKVFSDIRVKENITPLTALEHLPVYEYNYSWDDPSDRHIGVMAQDAEKVHPSLVKEVDGVKAVDLYGLLGVTMSAVKELHRKVEKIQAKGRK